MRFSADTGAPAWIAIVEPGWHSVLHSASPGTARTEWLYWVLFWILFSVFVLVIFAAASGSAKSYVVREEIQEISRDNPSDRTAGWAVGVSIALTIITLIAVLVLSLKTGDAVDAQSAQNDVTIDIKGHQWWWEITYPNAEADLTVSTANEIHIPVGKRIEVITQSADVIHSFWAPSLSGKRDLIPGMQSAFSFEADQPGIYRGQCAEFCGLQHAHMGFAIIAESPEEFAAWERDQLQAANEPQTPDETRGRSVFLSHACVMCHTIRGTDAGSHYGPDLTHIASRQMIAAETLPNVPGALTGWIVDPQGVKPGNHMAPNLLQPDDLHAVVAYLESLH